MNKYKKAYCEIAHKFYSLFDKIDDDVTDDEIEYFTVLKELVERATPKKIVINNIGNIYYASCPSCKKMLSVDNSVGTFPNDSYCPRCGQRLEWYDEDE